jgi:cation diffusion facilitator family transporter
MNKRALKDAEDLAKKSVFGLLLLGIFKGGIGFLTGMPVLVADAVSTFADILGVFASYMGIHLSRKTADKNFEYGYHKVETFAAFLISLGIIYLGYVVLVDSVELLQNPEKGQLIPFAVTITIVSIVLSYRWWKKLSKVAAKANSLSLMANAKDKKMDMVAGVAVLISIVANYQGVPYIEGIISILISLIILYTGIASTKESLFFLLDYWDDPSLSKKIRKLLLKEKGIVQKITKLRLRRAGAFTFGEAFVEVNPFAGMEDLRESLDLLKVKIQELNPYIRDFAIFTHISKVKNELVAIPIKKGRSMHAKAALSLKTTHAYLFVRVRNGRIENHYIKKLEKKDPTYLTEFLTKEKVNILIDNHLNSLVYYNLRRTHHILIYPNFPDVKTAKDTIKLLLLDT